MGAEGDDRERARLSKLVEREEVGRDVVEVVSERRVVLLVPFRCATQTSVRRVATDPFGELSPRRSF